MEAAARVSRIGSGCLWPRAFLCLRAPEPLSAVFADMLRGLDPDWRSAGGDTLLDVTHAQRHHGPPEHIAARVASLARQARIPDPVAVGVAATVWLARHAARYADEAIGVIAPWEVRQCLQDVPLSKVAALDPLLALRLAHAGVRTCGELAALPAEFVARRFGLTGQRLWSAVLGREPAGFEPEPVPSAGIALDKVLPPRTLSVRTLETYLRVMCRRIGARLQRLDLHTGRVRLRMRYAVSDADIDTMLELDERLPDGECLYERLRARFRQAWSGAAIAQMQLAALDLENASGQLELFTAAALNVPRSQSLLDWWPRWSAAPAFAVPAPKFAPADARTGRQSSPPLAPRAHVRGSAAQFRAA